MNKGRVLIRPGTRATLSLSVELDAQITFRLDRRHRTVNKTAQQQDNGGDEGEDTTLVHGDSLWSLRQSTRRSEQCQVQLAVAVIRCPQTRQIVIIPHPA